MESAVEVSVQATVDPNQRAFHVRFQLVSAPESASRGCEDGASEFTKLVLGIQGVAHVHVAPYLMIVGKAPLFPWSEVLPEVVELLTEFALSQRQMESACDGAAEDAA
jgi:hypothetical protein